MAAVRPTRDRLEAGGSSPGRNTWAASSAIAAYSASQDTAAGARGHVGVGPAQPWPGLHLQHDDAGGDQDERQELAPGQLLLQPEHAERRDERGADGGVDGVGDAGGNDLKGSGRRRKRSSDTRRPPARGVPPVGGLGMARSEATVADDVAGDGNGQEDPAHEWWAPAFLGKPTSPALIRELTRSKSYAS